MAVRGRPVPYDLPREREVLRLLEAVELLAVGTIRPTSTALHKRT